MDSKLKCDVSKSLWNDLRNVLKAKSCNQKLTFHSEMNYKWLKSDLDCSWKVIDVDLRRSDEEKKKVANWLQWSSTCVCLSFFVAFFLAGFGACCFHGRETSANLWVPSIWTIAFYLHLRPLSLSFFLSHLHSFHWHRLHLLPLLPLPSSHCHFASVEINNPS